MIVGEINKTIGQLFAENAAVRPDAPAIIEPDAGKQFTYAEFDRLTDRIAKGLIAKGIRKGTHTAICASDSIRNISCYFALWKIGGVPVLINPSFTAVEIRRCLELSEAEYMLADPIALKKAEIPVIPIGTDEALEELCGAGGSVSDERLKEMKENVSCTDPDTILFTSGTTSYPKPVMTTHFARVNNMYAHTEVMEAREDDVFSLAIPSFHCFSLTGVVLAILAEGSSLCIPADRRSQTLLSNIEKAKCTVLSTVPTMFDILLRRQDKDHYDISSLRVGMVGGSICPHTLYRRVTEKFNMALLPALGQTEATGGISSCAMWDPPEKKINTLGKFLTATEGCIKDPDSGAILGPDTPGEICIRGYNVMKGYYRLPEVTKEVVDSDGWLHTGDLGKIDSDGYLWYTGRLKEMIIRGGENIAPSEVEEVFSEFEGVEQVKVVGVPDSHYIEEACACIVPEKGAVLSPDELKAKAAKYLTAYKIPRYIQFFDDFPRTSTGKVKTSELTAAVLARLGLQDLSIKKGCRTAF